MTPIQNRGGVGLQGERKIWGGHSSYHQRSYDLSGGLA